jgi:hypothetical protein
MIDYLTTEGNDAWHSVHEPWKNCYVKETRHQRPHVVSLHLYQMSSIGKTVVTEKKLFWPNDGDEEYLLMGSESFWGDENILRLVMMVVQLCKYTKNY